MGAVGMKWLAFWRGEGRAAFGEMLRLNSSGNLPTEDTCLFFNALCPRTVKENLEWRRLVWRLTFEDERQEDWRKVFWLMCSRDFLFYVNTFLWTYAPKMHPEQPRRPLVTWKAQRRDLLKIHRAIGHCDWLGVKSRDVGGTWDCLAAVKHKFTFRRGQSFLFGSEKEDLVDKPGDPRGLFQKLDDMFQHEPTWLWPLSMAADWKGCRKPRHFENPDLGSTIDGEAPVKDFARAGRYTAIMRDEFSAWQYSEETERSTRDASACRLDVGTPRGKVGCGRPFWNRFSKLWSKDKTHENPQLSVMHWSDYPDKREGLYKLVGGKAVLLGEDYDFLGDFPFVGSSKPRSPWYDNEVERATNHMEIAQELDLDFHGSVELFVDGYEDALALAIGKCREPVAEGLLTFDPETLEPTWKGKPGAMCKIWCPFDGMIPPEDEYVAGMDFGSGTGTVHGSNSALVIGSRTTRELVYRVATNRMRIPQFTRMCLATCKWFHNAMFVPEMNHGSSEILEVLSEFPYWNLWYREIEQQLDNKRTRKIGYFNSDAGKQILETFLDAIERGEAIVPDKTVLDELGEYQWGVGGTIFHPGSKTSEALSGQGKAHGDVAIAAALCWFGIRTLPEVTPEDVKKLSAGELGMDTMAGRLKMYEGLDRVVDTDKDW